MGDSKPQRVVIFDTTLRDGGQTFGVNFSLEDKLRMAERLDELGVDFIEGGWPGSNPKDLQFFEKIGERNIHHASIVAFGSTRRADAKVADDFNIRALLNANTDCCCLVAKSWDFHVEKMLGIELETNLEIIHDSITYLIEQGRRVFLDAEHFFDGYRANPEYGMKVVQTSKEAGAECVILCDTNGGSMTSDVGRVVREVAQAIEVPLGIHCHNDSETAVANSLAAVEAGVRHVQGTINGLGERCGNANLISIIPNLMLKMGFDCLIPGQLEKLTGCSRFLDELLNRQPNSHQPYVGVSAFAHKGGIHVSAIAKDSRSYEHVQPEVIGNKRRVLVSDLSGQANIRAKAEEFGLTLDDKQTASKVLEKVKELENQGYSYEGAEASLNLLIREAMGERCRYFQLLEYRVFESRRPGDTLPLSEATVRLQVGDEEYHTASGGDGPVNALDNAFRKALETAYPALHKMTLIDYKVRVLASELDGTASLVRVLVESGAGKKRWGTIGVSPNIIEASWQALADAIDYFLHTHGEKTAHADAPAQIHFR